MIGKLRELWFRLRGTATRLETDRDVTEEFQFHLEQATERYQRRGMSAAEARRQAVRDFGGLQDHRESAGDHTRSRWIEGIADDIRFGVHSLRKSPQFTTATIATVALCVGANTAIFSVVDGVILKPLPIPDPGRVSFVGWDFGGGRVIHSLSAHQLLYLRERSKALPSVATTRTHEWSIGDLDAPETARVMTVSADFFSVIGIGVAAGRVFAAGEYQAETPTVIITDGFRRARLGDGDPIGRTLRFEGRSYTVVGVLPPSFRIPGSFDPPDLLRPFTVIPDPNDDGQNYLVIARASAEATSDGVTADLERVSRQFRAEHPDRAQGSKSETAPARFVTATFQEVFVGDLGKTLWILFGAIAFVTLIGCANAANLLIARGISRERELAVRTALGAGRGRIVRLLLFESLLLSGTAGLLGLVVARIGIGALLVMAPAIWPGDSAVGLDWRVVGFTAGLSVLIGLTFGLTNALAGTNPRLLATLGRAGKDGTGGRRRAREVLIVVQTAVAMVLLVASALLIESFTRLRSVDPGFDPRDVAAIRIKRMPSEYEGDRLVRFETQTLDQIRALPGVQSAAAVASFPFERGLNMPVTIAGRPQDAEGSMEWRFVSAEYFQTLGIRLVRGRNFQPGDDRAGTRVAIVNESFVRRYWPNDDPIGQRIEIGRWKDRWLSPGFEGGEEIIGVVADVREIGLAAPPRRTAYTPRTQWGEMLSWSQFVIRTSGPTDLSAQVTDIVRRIDPRIQTPALEPMSGIVQGSIAKQRFQTALLTVFGLVALLLTAVGIYGVVAAVVGQRVREIGVRVALGASIGRVLGLVAWQGMRLVLIGAGIGLIGAAAASRLLAGMLFGVTPTDLSAQTAAVVALMVVGLAATLVPARRAATVDPVEALRAE